MTYNELKNPHSMRIWYFSYYSPPLNGGDDKIYSASGTNNNRLHRKEKNMKLSKIKENALIVGNTKCLYYNSNDMNVIFCGDVIPVDTVLTLSKRKEDVTVNYNGANNYDDFDDILQERIKIGVNNGEMKIKLSEKKVDFDEAFTIIKAGGDVPSLFGFFLVGQIENGETEAGIIPIPIEADYKAICIMLYKIYKKSMKVAEFIQEVTGSTCVNSEKTNVDIEESAAIVIDIPVEEGEENA